MTLWGWLWRWWRARHVTTRIEAWRLLLKE
jgi:hypothetical protein